ncbi:MAG: response regulator transcription factor [Planctomycetia bacterium]|nr:response regulator transcription factor [Planctomycetia bacterium]
MAIRMLVADDHEVIRSGMASMLEGTDIEIVGEAGSGEETVTKARELKPDVISLDIRMENGDGLTALEQIREAMPDSKVMILSTFDNPTYVARAHALGAKEYVLKGSSRDQLVEAIRAVAAGKDSPKQGHMSRIAGQMATRNKQPDSEIPLTQRETQVLRHLALGLSNKEIAQSLEISIETVKEHVQHLLRKMGVNDRTQAAVWAVRKGLV